MQVAREIDKHYQYQAHGKYNPDHPLLPVYIYAQIIEAGMSEQYGPKLDEIIARQKEIDRRAQGMMARNAERVEASGRIAKYTWAPNIAILQHVAREAPAKDKEQTDERSK